MAFYATPGVGHPLNLKEAGFTRTNGAKEDHAKLIKMNDKLEKKTLDGTISGNSESQAENVDLEEADPLEKNEKKEYRENSQKETVN
jgi:hypothetical protein